jgi:hypothetical protein
MNVEIGAEAALFPEKEYISVIFVALRVPFGKKNAHSCVPLSHRFISRLLLVMAK